MVGAAKQTPAKLNAVVRKIDERMMNSLLDFRKLPSRQDEGEVLSSYMPKKLSVRRFCVLGLATHELATFL